MLILQVQTESISSKRPSDWMAGLHLIWGTREPKGKRVGRSSNQKNTAFFDVLVGCLEQIIPKCWFHSVFFLGGGGDDDIPCGEPRYSLANWIFVILASIPVLFTYTLYGTHIFPTQREKVSYVRLQRLNGLLVGHMAKTPLLNSNDLCGSEGIS